MEEEREKGRVEGDGKEGHEKIEEGGEEGHEKVEGEGEGVVDEFGGLLMEG